MRTALVVLTPLFGIPAALFALDADGRLLLMRPLLTRVLDLVRRVPPRAVAGLFLLVMLVQAVETAKFVVAWTHYKAAVRALATGTVADPAIGSPRFVSSDRVDPALRRYPGFRLCLIYRQSSANSRRPAL